MGLDYTPDDDIKVHEEGAIKIICAGFQTHENGIPEWIKNSSDEYGRCDAPADRRVIVVLFHSQMKSVPSSISVLDFNGMTSKVIENDFRVWADPDASQRANPQAAVQGGLGNGGKCYMTMLFEEHAILHTVKSGLGNRYGVRAGSVHFGYVPDRKSGRDYQVRDVKKELLAALFGIGVQYHALPAAARQAFESGSGFTLVSGTHPKGFAGRIPVTQLIAELLDHSQMTKSLEFCQVYVMYNGASVPSANPLVLELVTPDAGFSSDRILPVPDELVDPVSGVKVSTTDNGKLSVGSLSLRTSAVSMRWSRKARHTIVYKAKTGFIGFKSVLEFDVNSAFRDRIYGECTLLSLEPLKQNTRQRLAVSPLSRAVEAFISTQIEEYAREFEARDRRQYSQDEKDELSKINEALDKWKNQFMANYLQGLWGSGGTGTGTLPLAPPLPSGVPKSIEVGLSHSLSGVGVSFRPTLKFFERDARRIRPTPYRWVSDDTNVAWVDSDLNIVSTYAPGTTKLWAETLDGKVKSESVTLQVVKIRKVRLTPEELQIPMGSRRSIVAECELSNGQVATDIYLIWFETKPIVAQVSAAGHVYGHSLGATEVTAGDDKCMADTSVKVTVIEPETGGGEGSGRGFARILVSSVDDDPETGEPVNLASDDPPVYQSPRDSDRNVWWINSSAPLARMYLDQSKGYGYQKREWRMYHLERVIEVMVQIALSSDPNNESLDVGAWILKWGERVSEIQQACASGLGNFISSGELPGGA